MHEDDAIPTHTLELYAPATGCYYLVNLGDLWLDKFAEADAFHETSAAEHVATKFVETIRAAAESPATDPPRSLECSCCGERTVGRQWYNRDTGYGLCPPCSERLWNKLPAVEMLSNYGVPGVHYAISTDDEPAQHGPRCGQRSHGAAECDCGVADALSKESRP
jgi:hypothetical protein